MLFLFNVQLRNNYDDDDDDLVGAVNCGASAVCVWCSRVTWMCADILIQFTAITWLKEFVNLSGSTMLSFTSGILSSVLPCLAYDDEARISILARCIQFISLFIYRTNWLGWRNVAIVFAGLNCSTAFIIVMQFVVMLLSSTKMLLWSLYCRHTCVVSHSVLTAISKQRGLRGLLCRWPSITEWGMYITAQGCRLRNDLYCVEWDVKLCYTIPSRCTWVSRYSPFWILLELRMMDVVSGDNWSRKTCKAPVKSSPPTNQHTNKLVIYQQCI